MQRNLTSLRSGFASGSDGRSEFDQSSSELESKNVDFCFSCLNTLLTECSTRLELEDIVL